MSNAEIRGRFVWHELMTGDPEAAGAFYSKVVPWKTQPSGMPSYTLWMAGKRQAGGLMDIPEQARAAGAPPRWMIYIGTPDVDATVQQAEQLGGKVHKAPTDIPSVGRFAVLADPQGASFAVFTPTGAGADDASGASAPGQFSWHELGTTDQGAALRFYAELFGWEAGPAHDMGDMGTYQLIDHNGEQVGGIYSLQPGSVPPHWRAYVRVADAGKAAAAAKAAGGRVLNGPMEVPGGSRIAILQDPQGATFAVHELAKAVEPQPARTRKPVAPARKPAPAKNSAAARKKTAARRKAARRPAAGKTTTARKRPTAKRAAAKKSTSSAKRGKSAAKTRAAAAKGSKAKNARGQKKR